MKEKIHPQFYPEAQVICACGNTWTVGATVPVIRTDVCSRCHPFFTGEQRIVDSGGQVERFVKKLERRERMLAEAERRKRRETSPELPITELDLGSRAHKVLIGAGIKTVGDVLAKLEEGDETLTDLRGFGLKSLATLKKRLRARGFVLPGDEVPEEAGETGEAGKMAD
ncbi:MAG: 50S ribosomal protein L31 [Chloroflexi bacterium]|nr:MAG: 50S ribosomal protein L31 [Chloroflexota bacterium]RLC91019.1 MAG: 50S ribosomal protein L31 [Chloroflexota bacterium]HEY68937.1 50S ribosomal protein L31 [Thermoflexia bacterium]